ncbi:Crp/Fnr family transcriptional regulator [Sphingomonas sp. KR1UV-12]|uniref:Crp/Fnr family transcriptional regulator n=1 Tax=Sphingomonas aurea TaxID=3063994 RepID=A0ABT9EJU7_9SPHN|nr:Crp/Fnr family transcriptional regulator [Sphingomonas sp. KR1UV-12]MDP1027240.1 Crp/Fnr family transcriptional regulator [Sphingomonas sp. KR1UV-12]
MASHPLHLLVRKLEGGVQLDAEQRQAIYALPHMIRATPAGTYLLREGDPPTICAVLVTGYALRHKITRHGVRQIVSLQIPGEALDFQHLSLHTADHNIQTLTQADLALVPMQAVHDLAARHPAIADAILRHVQIEASIAREWMVNIGRRTARERLAHLLCEFACRLDAQGLVNGEGYELPMTQEQIGDALGLTSVHVNRSIRALEEEGLITRARRVISFPDIQRLRSVADFNDLYLHLRRQD